jgi:uncharacterized protein (UPF0333 family)
MFIRLNRKGQSTLEYTVIIAVIVAAVIMMQSYVKRSVQGRVKDSADSVGDQYSTSATGNVITNRTANTSETITGASTGYITSDTDTYQTQIRNAMEYTPNMDVDAWPHD